MKTVIMVLALVGVAACSRACCMEKCQSILYTCQRDGSKEDAPKCFETTNKCISACSGVAEN